MKDGRGDSTVEEEVLGEGSGDEWQVGLPSIDRCRGQQDIKAEPRRDVPDNRVTGGAGAE